MPNQPPYDASGRPSPWRWATAAVRKAASLPLTGLDALYQAGQAYQHFSLPVLNGAIGDQLAARHDARAITMHFRRHAADVEVAQLRLGPERAKTVVFVHGLMGDELIWQTDKSATPRYGPLLQQDLPVHCLYLRYNSGLHISENGRRLSQLLTELVAAYPAATQELLLIGHSMGGLVIRSAGHYGTVVPKATAPGAPTVAPAPWVARLRSVFLLGVPNEGSFLEQNSYLTFLALRKLDVLPTRLLSQLMEQRSNGIKDLRRAWLVDEDWQHPRAADLRAPRTLVPTLPGVHYHVLIGSLLKTAGSALDHYFGDGLVGGGSALGSIFGDPALPPDTQVSTRIFAQQSHAGLLSNQEVYAYLRDRI